MEIRGGVVLQEARARSHSGRLVWGLDSLVGVTSHHYTARHQAGGGRFPVTVKLQRQIIDIKRDDRETCMYEGPDHWLSGNIMGK